MLQAQERVRTHAVGSIRIDLLKEVRFTVDCRVSHWCKEDITFQADGEIKNKDIVSGSKGSMLRGELMFYFPQRMVYGVQNVR